MDPQALNTNRGRGFGSRLLVSPEALPDGWRFEKRNDKYCVWFDEKGKRYKSGTSLLRKVDVSYGIPFDLYGKRNEIGQVKYRFQA